MNDLLLTIIEVLIKGMVLVTFILLGAAVQVYLERKISAFIQGRIGPNRAGPFGLLQPFADVIKLFMKEDIFPKLAFKRFHQFAPVISMGIAIVVYAVIPFADPVKITMADGTVKEIVMGVAPNLNIGILFILAMTSVGVYGLTLAGWSSNSKYSLLGGLRSAAQMISYELSMGLAIIGVLMICGSFSLSDIVTHQKGWFWHWNIFAQPLAFIIFMVSSFAEMNRTPFDLPEAEPELVGGYNTEYSGMKFGMFFLAEYSNMATGSILLILLFFGGWHLPFPQEWLGLQTGSIALGIVQLAVFLFKLLAVIFFIIWVRWTVPRFRYDQLMHMGWRMLLPLALLNIAVTGIILFII
ncbi:MAG: NADH-quinone oxidoreductase subunit NuoH [Ignavibacteria bacterium]|nr:NADH-quinone oxidoreductase subunit NuoH [Ignavibacteria bacterium]